MAYFLRCDVCNTQIMTNEQVIELTLQEQEYLGETNFFQGIEHYSGTKILCAHCKRRLAEFFKLQVDFIDRF